jgi:ADP-ribose pyrophosphatase YjhB (NUDIX family)
VSNHLDLAGSAPHDRLAMIAAKLGGGSSAEVKEFLLEEYRAVTDSLANSEQAGETRVNWLIGIVTAALGGLIALYSAERRMNIELLCGIVIVSLTALLLFGIITLFRIMKRNAVTDGLKQDVAAVRQAVKDHFDDDRLLLYYQPFGPQYGPRLPGVQSSKTRPLGGLAHIVAAINALLAAGFAGAVCYFIILVAAPAKIGSSWVPLAITGLSAGALAWAFRRQHALVEEYDGNAKRQLREGRPTHAGGIVCRDHNGILQWLVVGPKESKQSASEERLLPKGHITRFEGHGEAALREVREETGVVAHLICLVDRVAFEARGEHIDAKFYLMEWRYDTLPAAEENRIAEWLSFEAALAKLNHVESKHLLRSAARRLDDWNSIASQANDCTQAHRPAHAAGPPTEGERD